MALKLYASLTPEDAAYLPAWKSLIGGKASIAASTAPPLVVYEAVQKAKAAGATAIVTTSSSLLQMLLESKRKVSVYDYAGSVIDKYGMEFLIQLPPEQCYSTNTGTFLTERYFKKFLQPDAFIPQPAFRWTLHSPELEPLILQNMQEATVIAVDIETVVGDDDRSIDCCALTAAKLDSSSNIFSLYTVVISLDDYRNLLFLRRCLDTPAPKVLQNGKYDIAYLSRYRTFVRNYAFDTINLFHSWYSELPKRLDFITSFCLRKWQFWKDEHKSSDRMQFFEYNAKDTYTTMMCFLALMREMPEWALNNFKLEFPLTFPSHLTELTGLKIDLELMEQERERFESKIEERRISLTKILAEPDFNPNSPKQVLKLFEMLGSGDVINTTPPSMDKVKHRHPLNRLLLTKIEEHRKDQKLVSNYLRDEHPKTGERKSWHGRIFYSLNPYGTDTGRQSSTESVFWCGLQLQNIPRDRDDIQIKRVFVSDPGFYFGECDRSQAETRDTAYLSGDTALLKAVEDRTKDFHGFNASAFFGLDYSEIVQSTCGDDGEWVHKTVNKGIRDTSKRTNHGANYNMGAAVLLATMKIDAVVKAQRLLKLPNNWSLLQVTQWLLDRFDQTYPVVRGEYYNWIKACIRSTKLLVGPTGWTRYCFGKPWQNKQDMNAYAAHPSQSLNAMELNNAYLRVFKEVALPNPLDFKLGPQIHDSIFFQYKKGRIDLAYRVAECMDNPIEVTDIFGNVRVLRIPVDIKGEAERWSEVKTLPARPASL